MAASVDIEKVSKPLPVVGVVQMTTGNDKEANWLQGKALVEKACRLGAQVKKSHGFLMEMQSMLIMKQP